MMGFKPHDLVNFNAIYHIKIPCTGRINAVSMATEHQGRWAGRPRPAFAKAGIR